MVIVGPLLLVMVVTISYYAPETQLYPQRSLPADGPGGQLV